MGQMSHAVRALTLLLFPPRCGACGNPWIEPLPTGLCPPCFELLELNNGPRCKRCDAPCERVLKLCSRCRARNPSFERIRAPYLYGGPLMELIRRAKFQAREDLASALGRLVASHRDIREAVGSAPMLCPVPLGHRRARHRGYNQSAWMARALARELGGTVTYPLLRVRHTQPQSDLPLRDRAGNVKDAFACAPASGSVVLVDDVVTSAETVHQASVALRRAGVQRVVVVAAARAE